MAKVSEKNDGNSTRMNVITYPQCSKNNKNKSPKAPDQKSASNAKHPSNNVKYVPDTNLTLACLVCLCFNMPLGAIAMYLSLTAARAYRDGDERAGERRAKWSVFLSLFSIVTTVLIVMSAVLWLAIDKQAQREMQYRART